MTIEQKAKAYDKALGWMRELYPGLHGATKEDAEHYFPELHESESEDERIRKELVQFLTDIKDISESGRTSWAVRKEDAEMCNSFLAYLEKQKKQDSEDEEDNDFTIFHPLKNGKGEYECIPYSFYGSMTSFSEDKDLIDFLRTCFYTEEECNEWIEQQKEQKPAECINIEKLAKHIKAEFESFRNLLKKKGIDYQPTDVYWTDYARLFVSSSKKLQKPEEYSPLCNTVKDKIREYIANHFVSDTVVKTDVKSIVKAMEEGIRLGREECRQIEWSDEDKLWLSDVYFAIDHSMYSEVERQAMKKYIDYLRYQSQQKTSWSEEDEKILHAIEFHVGQLDSGETINGFSSSDMLRVLKSISPQPQKNMSIGFMLYLDEHRPDGKMYLSNAECNEIEIAFKNQSWDTILRYVEKYQPHWKPSEEQIQALEYIVSSIPPNYLKEQEYMMTLIGQVIQQLKKL